MCWVQNVLVESAVDRGKDRTDQEKLMAAFRIGRAMIPFAKKKNTGWRRNRDYGDVNGHLWFRHCNAS